MKKYKVGLALSGGSIKGLAHVGALQAFEELGIKIDIISGVSAGAIIASMYAAGVPYDDMINLFKKSKLYDFWNLNLLNVIQGKGGGFIDITPFRRKLKSILGVKTFEELRIPLVVSATELSDGCTVYFDSGELLDPIIASASIPILFSPIKINKKLYIDGGVMSNITTIPLRDECEFLFGIHVNPIYNVNMTNGIKDVFGRTFDLVINGKSTETEKKLCDHIFEFKEVSKYSMFELSAAEEIREIGYRVVKEQLINSPILDRLRQ